MHNPNEALLGSTQNSYKEVSNHKGVITAGYAVCLKSDDTLSVAKADGNKIGISVGKDLSDIGYTAICRKGVGVPIVLTDAFDPVIGATVNISDTTGKAIASGAGATAYNAVYASERIGGTGVAGGIQEDGTTIGVAYIDFPGGL